MSAVSEIMSPKDVVAIRVELNPTALDVAKMMLQNKVGSVVIVKNKGHPIGIITDRDFIRKVSISRKDIEKLAAKDIMSHPVKTIKAYDSIETAAAVMTKNKIKRLVVLEDDGSIAGVISVSDMARKLAIILSTENSRYSRFQALLNR
jgi:CBS domain-containing protein